MQNETMKKSKLFSQPYNKLFFVVMVLSLLMSCSEYGNQYFIFKRYNSDMDNWEYFKTSLYRPSVIEEIKLVPCSKDKRIEPYWSPNGKYYGCSAVYDQPLIIYDTNNEVMSKLNQGNPEDPLRWWILGWSPDSQYVSIMNTGSKENPYYDFSIMKYDGSGFLQIDKQTNASMSFGGKWAPNGNYIVRQVRPNRGDHDYLIISSLSGNEIFRYDLVKFIHAPIVFADQMEWSPDSKKLALSNYHDPTSNPRLYILDIENGNFRDVIPDNSICIKGVPDWSPDGKKLLFDSIGCKEHFSIDFHDSVYYSINADGTKLKQLTEKGFGSLNWTLDGKSIIISGYNEEGMYLMDIDGSNKRKLLDNGYFVSWIKP